MFESTQAERVEFTREARKAYPTLDALQATLRFALDEARDTFNMLTLTHERKAGHREHRDKR